jgi:hypothetical protein
MMALVLVLRAGIGGRSPSKETTAILRPQRLCSGLIRKRMDERSRRRGSSARATLHESAAARRIDAAIDGAAMATE